MNPKTLPAFSLLEISIVLAIMGILMGAVLKGQELIESARLKSLVADLNSYRAALLAFEDKYNAKPGDYAKAAPSFDGVNGDGDGVITGQGLDLDTDAGRVWTHLALANLIPHPGEAGAPVTKLGGLVTLEENPDGLSGLWMIVGAKEGNRADGAMMTPLQAQDILTKFGGKNPTKGTVIIKNGRGKSNCLKGDVLNLETKEPACILYVKV